MKTRFLFLILMMAGTLVYAQPKAIDDLFDKYSGKDGFTVVDIGNGMLTLASWFSADDPEEKELLKEIDHVRILALDSEVPGNGVNFYNEVIGKLNTDGYKELMTIKEKGQDVRFWAKESDGVITDLLFLAGGDDNALISIQGKIKPSDVGKIAGDIHVNEKTVK